MGISKRAFVPLMGVALLGLIWGGLGGYPRRLHSPRERPREVPKAPAPERVVRALSLEEILEELKADLIRHRYGQLVERVDEQLFPYRQLEQKLGELTGISFRDKPLPRLKVHRFNGEGEAWDGPEEVAALYRREENTIYFDPSILIEREKEAIYHEFFHSKGHFVSAELNEGWVEYLTVLATGLPPARYGMRAFNVHNLVFLLGQLSARAGQDPYGRTLERPGAGPGELNPLEVQRRGRLLLAQAFHGGSLAHLYLEVYQDRQAALRYFREVIRQAPLSQEAESSRKICLALEPPPRRYRS